MVDGVFSIFSFSAKNLPKPKDTIVDISFTGFWEKNKLFAVLVSCAMIGLLHNEL